jgi:hypothetical protein
LAGADDEFAEGDDHDERRAALAREDEVLRLLVALVVERPPGGVRE